MMNTLEDILTHNPWSTDEMYDFESEYEKSEFFEWFKKEARHYTGNMSYSFSSQLLKEVIPSGCYGNGQYISLKDKEMKYVEGIVSPEGTYVGGYIPHGFNVKENRVTDYTYKKIVRETPHFLEKMPTEYWGIEIPLSYIERQRGSEPIKPNLLHKPLLLQYWRDNFKSSDKV